MLTIISKAFMMLFFATTFVTKTIHDPIFINISPADLLWPFMAILFIHTLYKSPDLRKTLYADKNIWLLGLLFCVGIISAIYGYVNLEPSALSSEAYRKSLVITNVKNLLIVGYFFSGWLLSKKISDKTFLVLGVCVIIFFSFVGIFAKVTGYPEWAMSGNRLLSTVNDPNVAGFICLIGLLFCWRLLDTEFRNFWIKLGIVFVGGISSLGGIFLTGSRTSMLVLALLCFLIIIDNFKRWKVLISIFSMTFFILSGLYNLDTVYSNGENYRYLSSRFFNGTELAHDFRSDLRKAALMMGKDNYMTGVGPGQFPNFSTPYYENIGYDVTTKHFNEAVSPKVPHNTYLTYFAERGILGIGLFMGLIVYGLVQSKGLVSRTFLVMVMTYALFFNVENIRILWLIWGGRTLLDSKPNESVFMSQDEREKKADEWKTKRFKNSTIGLILIFALSLVSIEKVVQHMYRPYVPLLNQSVEVLVEENGLDLMLEFTGGPNDPLFIKLEGDKTYERIIRNRYGFYKDKFDLPQGNYKLTLSSGSGQKKYLLGSIKTGDQEYLLYNGLIGGNLVKREVTDDIYILRRSNVPIDTIRTFESVDYAKVYTVYLNEAAGINFENIIQINTIMLKTLKGENQYEMIFEFTKTGQIDKPLMFLARGYDLRDSRKGKGKNIRENITFEPALTELEIGQTFTGTWTFDTEGRPYMLQYSFYYTDPETGKVTQPYPMWVLDGYVQ